MKKTLSIHRVIGLSAILLALLLAGCSLINPDDVIVGKWQQISVAGIPTVIVTVLEFTADTYTGPAVAGTWKRSGKTYTLTGSFLGFLSTTSTITPDFTSSDNTMTYTDGNSLVEVYHRQ